MLLRRGTFFGAAVMFALLSCTPPPKLTFEAPKYKEAVDENAVFASKKRAFFADLMPFVIEKNTSFKQDRVRMRLFMEHNDTKSLSELAQKYQVDWKNNQNWRYELLTRIDEVPAVFVASAAAYYSDWGQNIGKDNNLFAGVQNGNFESIEASLHAYMDDVNTAKAHEEFRVLREGQKALGSDINDPFSLLNSMHHLDASSRKALQMIMTYNRKLIESFLKKSS